MSETRTHQFERDFRYTTGQLKYLYGQKVKPNQVLKLTHLSGTFENCTTTEYIELGYYNGHEHVPLKKDKPTVASDMVFWDGEVYLRDNQYYYVYCADIADGEVIKLRANGKWEK